MKVLIAGLFVLCSTLNPAHHAHALPAPGVGLFNGLPSPAEVINEHASAYKDIIPQPPMPTDVINEQTNTYKNFIPQPAIPFAEQPAQILGGQQGLLPNIQDPAALVSNSESIPTTNILDNVPAQQLPDVLPETPAAAVIAPVQQLPGGLYQPAVVAPGGVASAISPVQQLPITLPDANSIAPVQNLSETLPGTDTLAPVQQLPGTLPGTDTLTPVQQLPGTLPGTDTLTPVQQLPGTLPGTDTLAPVQQLPGTLSGTDTLAPVHQLPGTLPGTDTLAPVQQLPGTLPGTDTLAPVQQLPGTLPGTDVIAPVQQLPGTLPGTDTLTPVQQLPGTLPDTNSIAPVPQLPAVYPPTVPSGVTSAIAPVQQLPAQQLPPVSPSEPAATAIDTTSTIQKIVAEKVEDTPAANSNPFSSYFNPSSFYKFVPNSDTIPQSIPGVQDYQSLFNNFAPGSVTTFTKEQNSPPGVNFETLNSIWKGQPQAVESLGDGFPGSQYVQSASSVPFGPRAVEETVVYTSSTSGFKDIFQYKSYESEFEALTKDEGKFSENSLLLNIATTIVKKMGEAQRAVTPVLVKLIEDPSGLKTVQICNYSKGRLALTRAVKEFTAELSHLISVDANESHADCRIKAYQAFRILQDTLKEVRRNLTTGSEVVPESDPIFFIDEIEKLIQEGIRQLTSKTV